MPTRNDTSSDSSTLLHTPQAAEAESGLSAGVRIGVGIAAVLPAMAYGAVALSDLSGPSKYDPLGEAGWPMVLAVSMVALGAMSILKGLATFHSATAKPAAGHAEQVRTGRLSAICLLLLAYGLGLHFIGFYWVTLPFVMALLHVAGRRRPIANAILGAVLTLALSLVFEGLLQVQLP